MVDNSRRARVGLGVIGLGPGWDQVYRDALNRLKGRLTIRVVYDPVEARSKSVASEWDATAVSSLRQLIRRQSLQGFLVFDAGWCQRGLLSLIANSGKPAFLSSSFLRHTRQFEWLAAGKSDADSPNQKPLEFEERLMPELSFRFTPASCRLRELVATKLGSVREIQIECDWRKHAETNALLIDWCIDMMGRTPLPQIEPIVVNHDEFRVQLLFPSNDISADVKPNESHRVTIQHRASCLNWPLVTVTCQHGSAILRDRTHLQWQTDGTMIEESLADERNEIEILIDQFCRRALGGLNPVGRLSEFLQAARILDAIEHALG